MNKEDMKISVIIAVYNQPRALDLVLTGYGVQTDSDFDVIIADDGSGPEMAEVIERHKNRWPYSISHVWQEDDGWRKSQILNKAIAASDADYLIFTDGDCIPSRDFVEMHRVFSAPGCYIAGRRGNIPVENVEGVLVEHVESGEIFTQRWVRRYAILHFRQYLRWVLTPRWLAFAWDRYAFWRIPKHMRAYGFSISCSRESALAVDGYHEEVDGMSDVEFASRLSNSGLRMKRIKNVGFMLHLDHERSYLSDSEWQKNDKRILLESERSRRTSWK